MILIYIWLLLSVVFMVLFDLSEQRNWGDSLRNFFGFAMFVVFFGGLILIFIIGLALELLKT